jgi:RNA recognition motif-containing protein
VHKCVCECVRIYYMCFFCLFCLLLWSYEYLQFIFFFSWPRYVGKFVKRSDRILASPDAKFTNLYVKNLDLDVTEELLREEFSQFGKIASLVISKEDNGTSRGFGFINFDNPDDARQAMDTMNGSQLGRSCVPL